MLFCSVDKIIYWMGNLGQLASLIFLGGHEPAIYLPGGCWVNGVSVEGVPLYWEFSLAWIFLCLFKILRCEKHFWQTSHWKGFSFVCVLIWFVSEYFCAKHFSQNSHWKGFSLVWILTWLLRVLRCTKHFSQKLTTKSFLFGMIPNYVLCQLFACCKTLLTKLHIDMVSPALGRES